MRCSRVFIRTPGPIPYTRQFIIATVSSAQKNFSLHLNDSFDLWWGLDWVAESAEQQQAKKANGKACDYILRL